MSEMIKEMWSKLSLVIQIWKSNEMIPRIEQTLELDIIVIRKKIKLPLDTGLVNFGVPNQLQI